MRLSREGIDWHLDSSLSLVNILACLYGYWVPEGRKRGVERVVILSKGHGSLALYATYAELGLVEASQLKDFARVGSRLQSHPSSGALTGIPVSTGSLGQGLSVAAGIALASRIKGVPVEVAVVLGDGELDEGQVWESAMTASFHGLGNLVALIDRNGRQHTGPTEAVKAKEPLADKWRSFGWEAVELDDGVDSIVVALRLAGHRADRPTAVIVHTSPYYWG